MQLAGQPIIILKENVERTRGHEALRSNIMAAKAIAAAVRTTLGPRGMDKMLVSGTSDVVVTNDGATILHELSIQHPGGKMVVEVAETQDDMVGDGTTTAVILVGALMESAEQLITQGIHPTVIAEGYRMGMAKALDIVKDLAITVTPDDRKTLMQIADTAMTGKSIESVKGKVDTIVVDAVKAVAQESDGRIVCDEDDVSIKKHVGESMDEVELVRGVVIDKSRVEEQMPRLVKKAKIALLSSPLEIVKTQVKSKIRITSPQQMEAFDFQERETLKNLVDTIVASGASVVICQKGIADAVQYYLAKAGILAVEDVAEKDMKFASRAVCGNIVSKPEDLTQADLGTAEQVEDVEDAELIKISGCKNPMAVTILLRGSTQVLIDELERAVYDGVRVVMDAMEDGKFVVGGGAVETELLLKLRDYANSIGGRTQLAIEAFAIAFETIPRTLAENSGFNAIDKLVDLKAAHSKGKKYMGLNVYTGTIEDMKKLGVFEPMRVKTQAIMSATEAATMLTRIDDMMVSSKGAPSAPGGAPPMG
ncbi:MAG: TCP-1/cpn60 chaperonin family protein [Methanomicrobiales archaeon]|nr:TCP-1/cpn60 chaperonin family protein [Methanomicrobiales archaeon]